MLPVIIVNYYGGLSSENEHDSCFNTAAVSSSLRAVIQVFFSFGVREPICRPSCVDGYMAAQ